MTRRDESVVVSMRLPRWTKSYIALASARLGIPKGEVVTAALKMHLDYLDRSGVIKKARSMP